MLLVLDLNNRLVVETGLSLMKHVDKFIAGRIFRHLAYFVQVLSFVVEPMARILQRLDLGVFLGPRINAARIGDCVRYVYCATINVLLYQ